MFAEQDGLGGPRSNEESVAAICALVAADEGADGGGKTVVSGIAPQSFAIRRRKKLSFWSKSLPFPNPS